MLNLTKSLKYDIVGY